LNLTPPRPDGCVSCVDRYGEHIWTNFFVRELRELGRIENRVVTIEYSWAEGRDERHAEIAAQFVRLKVDSAPKRSPLIRSLHGHHVVAKVRHDPDRADDDEKDDQHTEGEGQNIVRAVGAAAQMQKEDEVDADLREGEHDQPDRDARGPEQIGLRHDERGDRRQDRKPQPGRVRQVAGRGLTLFDARRAVVVDGLATVRQGSSPIR
jgi:hypothetical protein